MGLTKSKVKSQKSKVESSGNIAVLELSRLCFI